MRAVVGHEPGCTLRLTEATKTDICVSVCAQRGIPPLQVYPFEWKQTLDNSGLDELGILSCRLGSFSVSGQAHAACRNSNNTAFFNHPSFRQHCQLQKGADSRCR